jgi:hypothetical protein
MLFITLHKKYKKYLLTKIDSRVEKLVSGNHGSFPTHTASIIPVISINRKKNSWFKRLWVGVKDLHLSCLASFHVRILGFPGLTRLIYDW